MMDIKKEIKKILADTGKAQGELSKELGFKYPQHFSNKLSKGAYRVDEFDELLNHLGYELKIVKKEGE